MRQWREVFRRVAGVVDFDELEVVIGRGNLRNRDNKTGMS
jgi:hypothetical protein